jgi:hypothetical protein
VVVKSKRGRRRYVLFAISSGITKPSLIGRLKNNVSEGREPPYVVQCIPGMAIIRCAPEEKDDLISLMERTDRNAESILTSGTLRTIREKYPELKVPRKR